MIGTGALPTFTSAISCAGTGKELSVENSRTLFDFLAVTQSVEPPGESAARTGWQPAGTLETMA